MAAGRKASWFRLAVVTPVTVALVAYGKNIRELNLAKALTASTPSTTQTWFASNGTVGTCCAPYRGVGISLCDRRGRSAIGGVHAGTDVAMP